MASLILAILSHLERIEMPIRWIAQEIEIVSTPMRRTERELRAIVGDRDLVDL
jgi:hypothetical protein